MSSGQVTNSIRPLQSVISIAAGIDNKHKQTKRPVR